VKSTARKDDAFLADLAMAHEEPEALHVWWLGQSGFLVEWQGQRVLFDPYLSDSLTKKYAQSHHPHVRITEQVIAPGRLENISIVLASHAHTDHLDLETLPPLFKTNPQAKFIIPEAIRPLAVERSGLAPDQPLGLSDGESVVVNGCTFHGILAAHDTVQRDENGKSKFLGFIAEIGPWVIYHSGDTRLHDGLIPALSKFKIDLGFLPINGWKPEREVSGNLDCPEAVEVAQKTPIDLTVPHHYDMFTFNTADPAEFAALAKAAGVRYEIMQNGGRLSLRK
jgi:L-ascorbate metabolism protein UlaG (beta-lactamase superfamily)